ncbi:cbb3-type cytochrome c oxidase N-terminal domain-containing protein [Aureibaculum sp. 2210JD6-5]|uniref:cbb3-type cytochrome c oxidase N-terminal domain-containing protein n=1 Tax=Aureibaculum sp. 2210JD6-5 TaxID=3103957 RepID=UPI002AAE2747|nr:cbb3-type cytochrome c oxidase N-terminal domain-containing protein [Aureibaculum sp. 2210JD6-5]MDY7396666.1 cbb3-type cytochrome c oxidase N-terminal domain-containing protein [Aureibaculum sp. 2210JD6-5]
MSKNEQSFWSKLSQKLTKARPIENEEDIMTDHDYDGIRELDNVLPPWWVAGFYITIAVGIFYYIMVLFTDKYDQDAEYERAVAEANTAIEQYKKDNPELYDAANLKALTDAASIQKGKELFTAKTCTACHLADLGGSIGPNLTDEYWILDGDFQGIMNTIAKGGRPGKGMIAWESTISLEERQQLASYILSMKGTTPAAPKAPEGEVWKEDGN